jgi:hypothetical protein
MARTKDAELEEMAHVENPPPPICWMSSYPIRKDLRPTEHRLRDDKSGSPTTLGYLAPDITATSAEICGSTDYYIDQTRCRLRTRHFVPLLTTTSDQTSPILISYTTEISSTPPPVPSFSLQL